VFRAKGKVLVAWTIRADYNPIMNIYISHAPKDRKLAGSLAKRIKEAGFKVFNPWYGLFPGDNWAKKIGRALEKADTMIVLLTPGAFDDDTVGMDIMHAVGELRFKNRVLSVLIDKAKPWAILTKLPQVKVKDGQSWDPVLEKLEELAAPISA